MSRKDQKAFSLHIVVSVFITMLLVGTGILGSVYSDDISSKAPFTYITRTAAVYVFWAVLVLSAFLFWAHQWFIQRKRALREQLFIDTISTMPPPNILEMFGETFLRCHGAYSKIFGSPNFSQEDIVKVIQQVLKEYCKLAQHFDRIPGQKSKKYAASIMLYSNIEDIPDDVLDSMDNGLRFAPKESSLNKYQGVLFLRTDLSSTSGADSGVSKDSELVPFSIGIPKKMHVLNKTTGRQLWRVSAGASMAFCQKSTQVYFDGPDLIKWFDEFGDITEEVRVEFVDYFCADDKPPLVGSFVSIPLIRSETDENEVPIGIVNIHSPKPDLLRGNDDSVIMFVNLTRPVRIMLIDLLQELREHEFDGNNFWSVNQ